MNGDISLGPPAGGTCQQAPLSYRSGVTAADVCAVPGTVTCTKLTGVGTATAGVYSVCVVAGNIYGRTTPTNGNVQVTTETTNLGVRAAFAAVTSATYYDIYSSRSPEGAAKFVGRITETQRGTGIVIDTYNHTTAGGTAGAVDIYVEGTGFQANGGQCGQNNAYIVPASPVVCTGYQFCDFHIKLTLTGDSAYPALTVIPALYNSRLTAYALGQPEPMLNGTASSLASLKQPYRVETRGNAAVALLVAYISGLGASLDIDYVLS